MPTSAPPARLHWCIACRACSANGAGRLTTVLWPPSATTLHMVCPLRCGIRHTAFPLVYIDDVVDTFIAAMEGRAARDCSIPGFCHLTCDAYTVTLGRLAELIESFRGSRGTLAVPDMGDAFTGKLYATYLSYLPDRRLLLSAGHALRRAWQLHRVSAHPGARAGLRKHFPARHRKGQSLAPHQK